MGTKKRAFTAEEVCGIISACGTARVSHFKWDGLEVAFEKAHSEESKPTTPHPVDESTRIIAEKIATDTLVKSEVEVKEEQLANMLIEDPLAYERNLMSGELEKVDARREIEVD